MAWKLAWIGGACGVLALGACGDDDGGGPTDAGSGMDAAPPVDAPFRPDGALDCEEDAECDDGIGCTRDFCDARGFCRNQVDPAVCDDGVFCNGVEQCDPASGCMPGPRETCNDNDVCTIDRCDEEAKTCRQRPLDFDGDGEVDWHCDDGSGSLGTDCDDRDPTRGMSSAEVCEDGKDNDCDEMIDESECGRPMHDTCEDPLDITGGGTFIVSNEGAISDFDLTCGGSGRKDLVLTFTLEEPKDVTLEADGRGVTSVALRNTCEARETEFDCRSGFPGEVRVRALPAGTYFAVVSDSSVGEIEVTLELEEATEAPSNESCEAPLDISEGGSFTGSFVDVADDLEPECGFSTAPDLVYTFTTTEPQDVAISLVSSAGNDTMSFAVRSACGDEASTLRCGRGSPAGGTLHQLPAGTYYLVIEGPSFREVDYRLEVDILPPTPPADGDSCANPIDLELGGEVMGTLGDKEDDHPTSCGFYYRDVVYTFTLDERSDVTIEADGGSTFMYASLRSTCTDQESRLRCVSGNPSRTRIRSLEAGTYYVLLESFRGTGYTLRTDVSPPTPSTPVSGNDTCETAHEMPAEGGLFVGDTTTLENSYQTRSCGFGAASNDAAFELVLSESQRVVASTEGSDFDTILHVHEGMCESERETYCNDDGGSGSHSTIDQVLGAGTWFFVVDGFGSASTGNYAFEVMVSDP